MRTNSDFLKQLRIEILETQKRRESFIKAKLTFVVGLLGIGAISIGSSIKTTSLLYLVPLVAFIFDLYILGEDFGVKRAGTFIRTSPAAPLEERIWEKGLGSKRDWYSYFAHPLSSIVVLTAAAVGIHVSEINILPFWPWIFINSVFILIVVAYKPLLKKSMQHFEDILDKEVRESDNKG